MKFSIIFIIFKNTENYITLVNKITFINNYLLFYIMTNQTPYILLRGAKQNNLKDISVKFPLGVLCGITGVSGSGKSTLTTQTLMPALKKHFGQEYDKVGKHKSVEVPELVTNIIVIDQSPIGKTPRSNPATDIKVFDDIRTILEKQRRRKLEDINKEDFHLMFKEVDVRLVEEMVLLKLR